MTTHLHCYSSHMVLCKLELVLHTSFCLQGEENAADCHNTVTPSEHNASNGAASGIRTMQASDSSQAAHHAARTVTSDTKGPAKRPRTGDAAAHDVVAAECQAEQSCAVGSVREWVPWQDV